MPSRRGQRRTIVAIGQRRQSGQDVAEVCVRAVAVALAGDDLRMSTGRTAKKIRMASGNASMSDAQGPDQRHHVGHTAAG